MSITVTFDAAPHVDEAENQNPDTYVIKQKSGVIHDTFNMILGKKGGKGTKDHAVFVRFEVSIPKFSTIEGVKISWLSSGVYDTAGGTSMNISGGFLVPQTGSYTWQSAEGVRGWNNNAAKIPFAEWGTTPSVLYDYDVFQGGARAFTAVSAVIQTTLLGDWSIGDGISAHTTVTGLVSQLQDFLDEQEGLRDSTLDNHIPVMFQIYRPYSVTEDHWQGIVPDDNSTAAWRPKLVVQYRPPHVPMHAESTLGTFLSAKSSIGAQISGEAMLTTRISADLKIGI